MCILIIFITITAISMTATYAWFRWSMYSNDIAYEQRKAVINSVHQLTWTEARKYLDAVDDVSLDQHAEAVRWRQSLVPLYGQDICNLMQWR